MCIRDRKGTVCAKHDDGTEITYTAGSAYSVKPGHDAWVVGEEEFVGYEFDSDTAATYAK